MKAKPSQYWAAAPTDEVANEINAKFDEHLQWLQDTGHAERIQKSYDMFYGFNKLGGFGVDKQDEAISRITVPHYKNLLSRIHAMTVQAKLSFQPKAINSDSKSQLQTDFAKGLLEYEVAEKGMGKHTSAMVETSLVMFGGYVYAPWSQAKGQAVRPDANGRIMMTGDQEFHVLNSFEVARSSSSKDSPWYIVETRMNRWELPAQYPEHERAILAADDESNPNQLKTPYSNNEVQGDDDYIKVRTLLHDKTPALPTGRITLVCGDEVISDSAFTYPKMPIVEMQASGVLGEVVADSPASALIGLQEVLDRVYSARITNVLNGCVSNIYSSDQNITVTQLRQGQNVVHATQPPIALSLVGQSPDADNLINDIINQETLLSGLNNTAKGNPEASLKSGTSLSLILSTAIQYISGLQQAYAQAVGELGTIVIKNLQAFCQEPRLAFIAGVAGKASAKQFTAKDIADIDRVLVDLGNPVTQTVAGRMELVQLLLQYQAIKDPSKIDDFLRTGNFEALTEDAWNESILIREENEMLRRGQVPKVLLTDAHPRHITEALTVLYSQEARNDPTIVDAVLAHVQEHIAVMKTVPPDLAAIIGLTPLPSQTQPPAGPAPDQGQAPAVMGAPLPNGRGIPPGFAEGYEQFAEQTADNPAAGPQV